MTRQHYEALALFIGELAELNDLSNTKLDEAITLAENYFAHFNPQFDNKKFNKAVYAAADKFQEQFAQD